MYRLLRMQISYLYTLSAHASPQNMRLSESMLFSVYFPWDQEKTGKHIDDAANQFTDFVIVRRTLLKEIKNLKVMVQSDGTMGGSKPAKATVWYQQPTRLLKLDIQQCERDKPDAICGRFVTSSVTVLPPTGDSDTDYFRRLERCHLRTMKWTSWPGQFWR